MGIFLHDVKLSFQIHLTDFPKNFEGPISLRHIGRKVVIPTFVALFVGHPVPEKGNGGLRLIETRAGQEVINCVHTDLNFPSYFHLLAQRGERFSQSLLAPLH